MPAVSVRFHGSLNDFLPPRRRGAVLVREFEAPPGIVDVIQALGVPHTEVDLILAGGRAVGFGYRPADGDTVEVYGPDRSEESTADEAGTAGPPGEPGVAARTGLVPAPPEPRRFVLDGHLGRLARYLRLLGFDSRYDRNAPDAVLARVSAAEDRILLTRDRGLLKRSIVRHGYLVRDDDPRRQLREVVARYELTGRAAPFSRCVRCNGAIHPVEKAEVEERLAGEPRTLRYFEDFGRCDGCGAIYWPGSHYERMSRLLDEVLHSGPAIGENRSAVSREDGR
jgi:uncharacterized protein with PIN domain